MLLRAAAWQGGVKTHVQGFCAQQGGARTVADSGSEDQESGSCGNLHIYVMVKIGGGGGDSFNVEHC